MGWFDDARAKSKAAAAKKPPPPAKQPVGQPRKGHHWDGTHELVVDGDKRSYKGEWICDEQPDDGEFDDDEGRAPAAKKRREQRPFQAATWKVVLPWLLCMSMGVGSPACGPKCGGCDLCSKLFCSLCIERGTGPCANSNCNAFKDGGCGRFHMDAVRTQEGR
jgi:hypothetical protein